jgi:hypothetical protein
MVALEQRSIYGKICSGVKKIISGALLGASRLNRAVFSQHRPLGSVLSAAIS